MQFLPIVDRELRAAARHSRTWWRRVLTLLLGLIILVFTWATAGRWGSLSQLGHTVFEVLSVFAFFYVVLAGPLATADCLSRERREGTLGLLFLTDLRGYDVVFGKLAASALDIGMGLLAALPLLAMPVLAGGVSLAHFASVALFLLNVMVLSLALGACASSFLVSGRASLALTFGVLLFLNLGLPLIGEGLLKLGPRRPGAQFLYMCCPYWGLAMCLDTGGRWAPRAAYWLNFAGTHGLAWILLVIACFRTGRYWRQLPESQLSSWWHGLRERRRKRNWARIVEKRCFFLDHNPIAWVEGRDRTQQYVLALLVCGVAAFCVVKHTYSTTLWPRQDWVILWPLFAQYVLCLWIAIQAPRRFADDRQSGALELLLCTPLPTRDMVKGALTVLWRRFGRPLIALVLIDGYLLYAHFSTRPVSAWSSGSGELTSLYFYAAIVFAAQGYAFARVGLYQGLVRANSLRATFTLVWGLGVLPWALFVAFLLACDFGRRYLPFMPRVTEQFAFASWTGAHLVVFALFLGRASWELRNHFRDLAAGVATPWWKRAWHSLAEDFD